MTANQYTNVGHLEKASSIELTQFTNVEYLEKVRSIESNQYTNGEYLEKVRSWHQEDSYWKAQQVLRMLQKHKLAPNSVYDIGCGAGKILVELQKNMDTCHDFRGFDISPQAISIANEIENTNIKFYNEDILDSEVVSPDLFLMLDVFEHISDYRSFLDSVRKKTDWIIFHIPLDIAANQVIRKSKYMRHMHDTYGHLHFFTKETALYTLSDLDYDIVDYFYTDDKDIDGSWGVKPRLSYGLRKMMFHLNSHLTASFFNGFNLLVLARGDRAQEK